MNMNDPQPQAGPSPSRGRVAVRPANRPSAPKKEGVTPLFVLHAVRRWWKIAAPLGIFLAVGGAALVFVFFKPMYLAVGRIRILEQQPHIAFPDRDAKAEQFVQTQLQILRLPVVLRPVLADPEIARHPEIVKERDPLAYLTESIKTNAIGKSEIYAIEYEAADPQRAKQVVDAVIRSYMSYTASFDSVFRQNLMTSLEREIDKRRSTIKLLHEQLRKLTEQTGLAPTLSAPGGLGGLSMGGTKDPLSDLEGLLVQAEVDILLTSAAVESERTMSGRPAELSEKQVDRLVAGQLFASQQELEALRQQVAKAEAAAAGKTSLVLEQQRASLKAAEQSYEKLESELRARTLAQWGNNVEMSADARLQELEWKLATARATKEIVTKRLEEERAKATVSIGDQLNVDFANRELLQAESLHEKLVQQKAQLSTEENAPSRVMTLDGAEGVMLPMQPVKSLPWREMFAAIVAGFGLPFGLALAWELTLKRITGVDELRQNVGMPILGEIAALPTYGFGRAASRRAQQSRQMFEESVDGLRTTLVLGESLRHVQVFAIASAVSSEGKTSVATHLAMSLARTTAGSILLIDGDLRAPDVHRMFDVPLTPGLVEVLNGDVRAEQAICTSDFARLDIMPAGELATNPHRLLHNSQFPALLEALRDKYAYVVIDTPPVLAASESLVFAHQADATILCAMRDRTRVGHVQQAQARLESAGAKTIGIVMSGIPTRNYASRYGSYSYGT